MSDINISEEYMAQSFVDEEWHDNHHFRGSLEKAQDRRKWVLANHPNRKTRILKYTTTLEILP